VKVLNRKRKQNYLVSIFLLIVFFLNILPVQSALALNGSGAKATNYQGFRYVDSHTIQFWSDKNVPSVYAGQFRLYQGTDTSGTEMSGTITAVTTTATNITGVLGLGGGKCVQVTTTDTFVPGSTYTLDISNTLKSNNGFTLGGFYFNKDITIPFTVPDTSGSNNSLGTYTSASNVPGVLVTKPENDVANVPLEGNIGFSLNMPATKYADVLSGMVLKKNGTAVILDFSIDGDVTGDIYAPLVNDDHTYFFYPMTGGGTAWSYNLSPGSTYELDIPAITLINGQTIAARTITFSTISTLSDDITNKFATASIASVSGENVNIGWSTLLGATGYNVYASKNKYFDFVKLNTSALAGSATSYSTPLSGLDSNSTYYFRVTPLFGVSEGQYTDATSASTPAAPAPTVSSAATTDSTHIVLTMNSPLTGTSADPTAFAVTGAASNPTVTGTVVSGTTVTLTLSVAIVHGETITVSYAKTGSNNLTNGTEAANFSGQAVTTFTANSGGGGGGASDTPLASSTVQPDSNSVTTVQANDGTQILIPVGALSNTGAPVEITISQGIQTDNPTTPGVVSYDPQLTERSFGPSGTVFNVPVTITLPFGSANIEAADLSYLAVFLWQTDHWQKVGGVIDPVHKTVSVTVNHFSTYRIMADRTTVEERIGGLDRYETAVKIAQNYFATGADTVVLARGDSSSDALTSVPLAKHFNAPLLLTPQDQLPNQVLNELKTLGVKTVYIVGGEMAVSSKVAEVITGQGIIIQRVAGLDRYATAYEVAKLLGNTGQAVLVNGNDYAYPDALSISSWAAYNGVPILYADGTNTLPEVTAKAMTELKVSRTILVGGTAVLPKSLEGLVPNPERYAGVDRYDTNSQVLSKLQPNSTQIFVATGNDFADALAGAVVAGQTNAWLILTGSSQTTGSVLTSEQQQLLQSVKGVKELHVFGGTVAVPDATLNELKKNLSF